MKILSLRLRELGPFERAKFTFDGSLVGIVGEIGSGKSTIMESILSGVTGVFRKYRNLSDYVRDHPGGQKSTSGSIDVELSHQDFRLKIGRTISVSSNAKGERKGSQSARLKVFFGNETEAAEELSGVRAVDNRIRELLGDDITLLADYAFIQQGQTTAIVDSDMATRTRALHRLFNLERFEAVWKLLGTEVKNLPNIEAADDLASLDREASQLQDAQLNAQSNLATAEKQFNQKAVDDAEKDINAWEQASDIRTKVERADAQCDSLLRESMTQQGRFMEVEKEYKELNARVDELAAKSVEANQFLAKAQDIMHVQRQLGAVAEETDGLVKRLKEMQPPVQPEIKWTEEDQIELDDSEHALRSAQELIHNYQAFIDGGEVVPECPTCKQPVTNDLARHLAEAQANVAELLPLVTSMRGEKAADEATFTAYRNAVTTHNAQRNALEARAQELLQETANLHTQLPPDRDSYTEAACAQKRAIVAEHDGAAGSLNTLLRTRNNAERDWQSLKDRLEAANAQRSELQTEMASLDIQVAKFTQDHITRCRTTIKNASDARVEIVRCKAVLDGLQTQLKALELRRDRAQQLADRVHRIEEARGILSDARNVFSRDSLPMILSRKFLLAIGGELNRFLGLMQANFTARIEVEDNTYSFLCTFPDATEREASNLSGGERVKFATSFLLAVNEVMSARLGTFAMDEPTAQLSETTSQHFLDALEHVRRYAENTGMQIFMITHSPQLLGAFDQTITLSKEK